ncbi:MAG: hypothetical protein ND895_20765 [Pyrinomonadaceae bacterium]|nr:hypothetical protein [Pyrinomonadaceae bacterium]
MKRCLECEFIYEDDQSLCDMDGHELVSDPTLQSFQVNTSSTNSHPAKVRARRLALAGVIAALIGTLLSVGYSGLTSEYVPQTTKAPSTSVIRSTRSEPVQKPAAPDHNTAAPNVIRPSQPVPDQSPATPTANPTTSPSPSPRSEKTRAIPVTGSPLASSAPGFPSTAPGRDPLRSEPTKANHKKDSGIGRFLKKTGKILKRPFKF